MRWSLARRPTACERHFSVFSSDKSAVRQSPVFGGSSCLRSASRWARRCDPHGCRMTRWRSRRHSQPQTLNKQPPTSRPRTGSIHRSSIRPRSSRIIDGDTFEARVQVQPELDVDTKVRLRGVDAAELHARCASELEQGHGRACGAGKNPKRRRRDDLARRRR